MKASRYLGLPEYFWNRPLVFSKLGCSERLSTRAASPGCVCSQQFPRAWVDPRILAGAKRHHQFTTTPQAVSFCHVHVVTTSASAFV